MPLPIGYTALVQRLRADAGAGVGAPEKTVVEQLRAGGLPLIASVRAVSDIYAIPLGAAEQRVLATGVWSDVTDAHPRLR